MNALILVCLLALLPMCTALNCYSCDGTGCGDPFSASASGVSTMSDPTYTYCIKAAAAGYYTRYGTTACSAVSWTSIAGLTTGESCCTTDLCNGARIIYQTPILLAVTLAVIFAKFQWA